MRPPAVQERAPSTRRWRELDPPSGEHLAPEDERIGTLLRGLAEPAALPQARLDAVGSRLGRRLKWAEMVAREAASPRGSRRRKLASLLGVRWAAVAVVVFGMAGVVFARAEIAHLFAMVAGRLDPHVRTSRTPQIVAAPPRSAQPLPLPPSVLHAPAPAPPLRGPASTRHLTESRTDARPASVTALRRRSKLSAAAPAAEAPLAEDPPSDLGAEARLVRSAIERLRTRGDAFGALAMLDAHRARFPRGVLQTDAEMTRIEALLALGRDAEALLVLERQNLDGWPRSAELRLTRGELRAGRDCHAAIGDFDRLLGQGVSPAIAERALRGRAICRVRLGQQAAAATDLRDYLARFPNGKLAAEARRRLRR